MFVNDITVYFYPSLSNTAKLTVIVQVSSPSRYGVSSGNGPSSSCWKVCSLSVVHFFRFST